MVKYGQRAQAISDVRSNEADEIAGRLWTVVPTVCGRSHICIPLRYVGCWSDARTLRAESAHRLTADSDSKESRPPVRAAGSGRCQFLLRQFGHCHIGGGRSGITVSVVRVRNRPA